jgi:hypothetical protein
MLQKRFVSVLSLIAILVMSYFLTGLCSSAAAKQTESVDPAFDFTKVRTVLLMEPTFTYNGFDVSGDDRFVKYPDPAAKVAAMFESRRRNLPYIRYVTLADVAARVKADPALDCPADPGEFSALVRREMPKYVDLVMYWEFRDFGWFYEYHDAYDTEETVYDKVHYHEKRDGKWVSGWAEVPRTVIVHHPAYYSIYDSAQANFAFLDPRSWKNVWSFTDTRTRSSVAFGKAYDHSGPESMMNRIFDDAVAKMPVYPRQGR